MHALNIQIGWTPLICAAKNGHENVVNILLMAGAIPDTQDQVGHPKLRCISASTFFECRNIVLILVG